MITLALDTVGPATSVALWRGSGDSGAAIASRSKDMTRGHAEAIMPMVRALVAEHLSSAPAGFAEIDRIAVTSGPGSFTGIRIGVAAARGLGLAMSCPVTAVTGFEVAAALHAANTSPPAPFCVAFDARRSQVYLQNFSADGQSLSPPTAVDLEDAMRSIAPGVTRIIGSGGNVLIEQLARLRPEIREIDTPTTDVMTTARLGSGKPQGPPPLPLYLRRPDAKPQRPPLARSGRETAQEPDARPGS